MNKFACIVDKNKHFNAFYCKTCFRGTNIIYINKKKTYCDKCVPTETKKNSVRVNQNREKI